MIALLTTMFLGLTSTAALAQDYFGAIAYSQKTGSMGWSYNYKSQWKAEQVALKKCYKYASDCKIATWFRNACGAIAVGQNGGWGAHWGNSAKNAQWRAKKTCQKYDSYCQVKRWVCTSH